MDPKRGALIVAGVAIIIAIVGVVAFALVRNLVLDNWLTSLQPKTYDGLTVTPVQSFRHAGNTITLLQRPQTVYLPNRRTELVRFLEVEFNGKRLGQGVLPVIPAELGRLKVHYLIQPAAPEQVEAASLAVLEDESDPKEVDAKVPSYQSKRQSRTTIVYLYADPTVFTSEEFVLLVEAWVASESAIARSLEKSNFIPDGGDVPLNFNYRAINGLVLGVPPVPRVYTSEDQGRFFEGSTETLTVQPDGHWRILAKTGPVEAPLEGGIVRIRDGKPYLWTLELPPQSDEDTAGVLLADHLAGFYDSSGNPLKSTYGVDPLALVKPSPEKEMRAQAAKLGIKVEAPPPGFNPNSPNPLDPNATTAQPGVPRGIQDLPGYDPRNPAFQSDPNASGLPPESTLPRAPMGVAPY
jgi:hypothetical protein